MSELKWTASEITKIPVGNAHEPNGGCWGEGDSESPGDELAGGLFGWFESESLVGGVLFCPQFRDKSSGISTAEIKILFRYFPSSHTLVVLSKK